MTRRRPAAEEKNPSNGALCRVGNASGLYQNSE